MFLKKLGPKTVAPKFPPKFVHGLSLTRRICSPVNDTFAKRTEGERKRGRESWKQGGKGEREVGGKEMKLPNIAFTKFYSLLMRA